MKFRIGKGFKAKKSSVTLDGKRTNEELDPSAKPFDQSHVLGIQSPYSDTEDNFYESKPWLDSDTDEDFMSVKGDFTPSRGSTPIHPIITRRTWHNDETPGEESKIAPIERKQQLRDLLESKEVNDENSIHQEKNGQSNEIVNVHMSTSNGSSNEKVAKKQKKQKKTRSSMVSIDCLPDSIWKLSFKACRKKSNTATS